MRPHLEHSASMAQGCCAVKSVENERSLSNIRKYKKQKVLLITGHFVISTYWTFGCRKDKKNLSDIPEIQIDLFQKP